TKSCTVAGRSIGASIFQARNVLLMRRTESDSHSPGQQKSVLFNYTLLACCIGFSDWLLVLATILALAVVSSATRGAGTNMQALEHVLEQWAAAWSSSDVEKVLPLFTDNVVYEDVTFGTVNHGRKALRDFATTTFAAFQDLKFELKSRIVASDGKSGAIE